MVELLDLSSKSWFAFSGLGLGTHHHRKDRVWVGHLLSGYALPMEDPNQQKEKTGEDAIGRTWKQSIKASYEATRLTFPGGEILAHLDQKSFKGWRKNAKELAFLPITHLILLIFISTDVFYL